MTIDAGGGTDGIVGNGDGSRVLNIAIEASAGDSVYAELAGLTITGGDSSNERGGGISFRSPQAVEDVSFVLRDSTVTGNHSDGKGGGVSVSMENLDGQTFVNAAQFVIERTVISGNTSNRVGGWCQLGHGGNQSLLCVEFSVCNAACVALDGEWVNPDCLGDTHSWDFPSGDGGEFGDFEFITTFLPGDFNRDNAVDGADFLIWNTYKFQLDSEFTHGDGNGDGIVDGADFLIWNHNKFESWTCVPSGGSSMMSQGSGPGPSPISQAIDFLIDRFGVDDSEHSDSHISTARWEAFANAVDAALLRFDTFA